MTQDLSPRQSKILDYIRQAVETAGRPPSYREIAEWLELSIGAVQDHIAALKAKGVLAADSGKARGFRLVAKAPGLAQISLPILGRVPAGVPIEAIENLEGHVSADRSVAKGADYALRVQGDSMAPEILEGDLVLVKQSPDAEAGQRVVAHVEEGEATVKTLRKKDREAWLEPLNPKYQPIRKRFAVIGRVVGLLRRYRA